MNKIGTDNKDCFFFFFLAFEFSLRGSNVRPMKTVAKNREQKNELD
jgi:hypothetical protein